MSADQAQQLVDQTAAISMYTQEISYSAAQMNAAALLQAHVAIYLLGTVLLLGIMAVALLRPRGGV